MSKERLSENLYHFSRSSAGSIIATRGIAGTDATHLVLSTHLDTVPLHVPCERDGDNRPFEAATEASYFPPTAPTVAFDSGVLGDEHGPVAHAEREYSNRINSRTEADVVRDAVEPVCN